MAGTADQWCVSRRPRLFSYPLFVRHGVEFGLLDGGAFCLYHRVFATDIAVAAPARALHKLSIKVMNNSSFLARSTRFRNCIYNSPREPSELLAEPFLQLSPSTSSTIDIFVDWYVAESQPEVLRSSRIDIRVDVSILKRNSYGHPRM